MPRWVDLHAAARILVFCGWAVAVEIAAPSRLSLLAVAIATAFLYPLVRSQAYTLIRRTRWLLLVLFLAYAFSLPGEPLVPAWVGASPTQAGVMAGAERIARLMLMLAGLAVLLASTDRSRLIYGFYVLAAPFAKLGFDRRAFAVRVGLTLEYAGKARPPAAWWDALIKGPSDDGQPTRFTLAREPWQTRDSAVILASVLLIGFVWA